MFAFETIDLGIDSENSYHWYLTDAGSLSEGYYSVFKLYYVDKSIWVEDVEWIEENIGNIKNPSNLNYFKLHVNYTKDGTFFFVKAVNYYTNNQGILFSYNKEDEWVPLQKSAFLYDGYGTAISIEKKQKERRMVTSAVPTETQSAVKATLNYFETKDDIYQIISQVSNQIITESNIKESKTLVQEEPYDSTDDELNIGFLIFVGVCVLFYVFHLSQSKEETKIVKKENGDTIHVDNNQAVFKYQSEKDKTENWEESFKMKYLSDGRPVKPDFIDLGFEEKEFLSAQYRHNRYTSISHDEGIMDENGGCVQFPVVIILLFIFSEYYDDLIMGLIFAIVGVFIFRIIAHQIFLYKERKYSKLRTKFEPSRKFQRYLNAMLEYQSEFADFNKMKQIEYEKRLRQKVNFWTNLNGWDFEKEVARLYEKMGFIVKVTKGSNDGGVDIFLEKNNEYWAVQCKAHKKPVAPKDIRELYGVLVSDFPNHGGIFVSTGGYTSGAIDFAKNKPIKLVGLKDILKMTV